MKLYLFAPHAALKRLRARVDVSDELDELECEATEKNWSCAQSLRTEGVVVALCIACVANLSAELSSYDDAKEAAENVLESWGVQEHVAEWITIALDLFNAFAIVSVVCKLCTLLRTISIARAILSIYPAPNIVGPWVFFGRYRFSMARPWPIGFSRELRRAKHS